MKKILLFIFLAGTVSMSYAQDSSKTKLKSKQVADLKLDDKQSKEVQQINRSFMKSSMDIRNNNALSQEDKRKQQETLNAERTGKIKSVLNADQFAQWQSNREKTMARAEAYKEKRHRKDGQKGTRGQNSEEMVKALGLTDTQDQELKNINKDFMTRAGALKNKADLTKEQRHAQMKSLNEERLGKIKTALGDEQYAKYDEWRKKEKAQYRSMKKKDGLQMKMKKKEATNNL